MPDTPYLLGALVISAGVTWMLRAMPFLVISPLRRSRLIPYLAATMPVGVMMILTIYTMRNVDFESAAGLAFVLAVLTTIGLHLWRHNVLVSIFGGTVVHVILVSTVLTG
ncbi:branched-chain amino acid transporter permease [Leekyejoonella antrihumi]|uniref:Branched-chain amino acid ABC transporter n=1 Tax=Leekyejoonella antrihumi TaxID=1660198 RepID=A0A563E472_9MICO|nr:AzlD domain-containing protein [Leekyejoonella antrihumi]TWP37320.1 branched-chain amino acid ABC transporter [Leekyejoonella antrihumi]